MTKYELQLIHIHIQGLICQHDEQFPAGLKYLAVAYDLTGSGQDIRQLFILLFN
jgi:hypothetical protein